MPFKSKAQQRWMFAAEARGEVPKGTAKQWADETPNIKKLPERVKRKKRGKKKTFVAGLKKVAAQSLAGVTDQAIEKHNRKLLEKMRAKKPMFSIKDIRTLYPGLRFLKTAEHLAEVAHDLSGVSMADAVPGTELRGRAETGQYRGKNYRTEGVLNENREFAAKYKRKAQSARGGHHYGKEVSDGV